ncbi:MAG: fasciclin domain-containing protein [Phycisphaerae bacterium]|nr:fasciclin domain-containing protein [Phycisphaerae bacterium]
MAYKKIWMACVFIIGLAAALPGCSQWNQHWHQSACKKLLGNPSRVAHSPLYKIINCEPQFTTLAKAIRKAHLKETFSQPGAYYTFFAPTNAAFSQIAPAKLAMLMKSENRQSLRNLIFYHAIAHLVVLDPHRATLREQTANGHKVVLTSADGKIMTVNGVPIISGPIMVDNAAIYTIGKVLTPTPATR